MTGAEPVPVADVAPTGRRRPGRPRRSTVFFLLAFLLGGAAFIAVTPPGQNPDEATHFYRAWQIAQLNLVSDEASEVTDRTDDPAIGGIVPSGAPAMFDAAKMTGGFDESVKFDDLDAGELLSFTSDSAPTFVGFVNTAAYPPVAYVPQVLAIWVGELTGAPLLVTLYLGRVAGLLAGALVITAALRLAVVGRWPMLALALLPATVSQAASFSADGMTIASAFFVTALVLRMATAPHRASTWTWAGLAASFVVVALVKPTYAPLAAIVLVVPLLNRAERTIRGASWTALAIAAAAVPTLLWARVIEFVDYGVNPANDVDLQTAYVLENPLRFVRAAFNIFVLDMPNGLTDQKGDLYRGIFGDFAWLRAPLPMLFLLALVVVLVLSVLVADPAERPVLARLRRSWLWRYVLVGAAVGTSLGVAGALYLYYTPTYGQVVQGLQGRYFLPVLLALLTAFLGNRLVSERGVRTAMGVVLVLSLAAGVAIVHLRYFVELPT